MSSPTISIVIPLYNKETSVERSVSSVLNQSFQDFELIVVDDGSTDRSAEVVEQIRDNRIRVFHQENGGPSKARNTGVLQAKGDWVLFLDADDELLLEALEHLRAKQQQYPDATIIDGAYYVRTGKNEVLFPRRDSCIIANYKSFFYRDILPSTGHTLFHRQLLLRYPYRTNIRRYEDVELIMRILNEAKVVTTSFPIFYVNTSFSHASHARPKIEEDFVGHLDFKGKSFWERMCLYQFYLGERDYYPKDVKRLYPGLHLRYDILLLYKILLFLRKIHVL